MAVLVIVVVSASVWLLEIAHGFGRMGGTGG